LDQNAQILLARKNTIEAIGSIFRGIVLRPTETEKKEVISRALNLLGKLMKTQDGRE
jgi:hypothetical protein